jgi:hypothetical protein
MRRQEVASLRRCRSSIFPQDFGVAREESKRLAAEGNDLHCLAGYIGYQWSESRPRDSQIQSFDIGHFRNHRLSTKKRDALAWPGCHLLPSLTEGGDAASPDEKNHRVIAIRRSLSRPRVPHRRLFGPQRMQLGPDQQLRFSTEGESGSASTSHCNTTLANDSAQKGSRSRSGSSVVETRRISRSDEPIVAILPRPLGANSPEARLAASYHHRLLVGSIISFESAPDFAPVQAAASHLR